MLLQTPVGKTAITSLPREKFLTAVSCSCLAVNNFVTFAKNIQKRLSVYVPKICIVICVVPWRCSLRDNRNFDRHVSTLIQWQWPVYLRTGLTKNAGHPCRQFLSCLFPRLFVTLGFVFTASPLCLTTAKLHRLMLSCIKQPQNSICTTTKFPSPSHSPSVPGKLRTAIKQWQFVLQESFKANPNPKP